MTKEVWKVRFLVFTTKKFDVNASVIVSSFFIWSDMLEIKSSLYVA